ncbi:MAG: anti-sigma factor family protein [Vicinamibacterales bacterium]
MTLEFTCGDPATLAGYLYDECDADERDAVGAHLAACASCASELAALGATRTALASWTPPDAVLGFRITAASDADADAARGHRPLRWWQRPMPAWAQAAAAILIFAAGAAMGMRTAAPAQPAAPAQASAAPDVAAVSAADLEALEARLRAEMSVLRSPADAAPVQVAARDAALVPRIRTLLAESEQRQQRELALRLTQMMRDMDAQRRMDLSNIERTLGLMEGFTRPELADQRHMINYLIQRTSAQRPPQR